MNYVALGCFLLLPCLFSQAQTLNAAEGDTGEAFYSQPCTTNCVTEQDEAEPAVRNDEVPDAPSATTLARQDTFVWPLTEPTKQPTTAPPPVPIWDKKILAANIFLAGATIFDIEMTHEGIAHHKCVEGNLALSRQPSRGELYFDNLQQFVPVVVISGLTALSGRAAHLPVWFWKTMEYMGPVYGSTIHLRGGIHWYTRCW
jgi:hypothetical protein